MKMLIKSALLLLLTGLLCINIFAQGTGRGWGIQSSYQRMFDLAKIETLRGEIFKIEKFKPFRRAASGIHLVLLTSDNQSIDVHVGPSWYLDNQDTKLTKGDQIEVTGSIITYKGETAIIAAEIKRGDQLLKLRDEKGFPYWAGWRRMR